MKFFGRATGLSLWLVCLTGCLHPVPGMFPVKNGQAGETIYVVDHGWHTGIIVKSDKLPAAARPQWSAVDQSKYLEIGWGDEGFYRAEKITSGITLKAMFWRNASVLHVVAMDKEPEAYFPYSAIIRVAITTNGFDGLCDYLSRSYATNSAGRQIDLGKGIYGNSRFFRAVGRYYFPNTCNRWTAGALRATGAPISPFYAVRAENVLNQTRKFGAILQKLSDE